MANDVVIPALGMARETGTLIEWLKAAGDQVAKGEPLMEIETDKATVEIEAPASGILANVTAQAGDVIPVGQRTALSRSLDSLLSNPWLPSACPAIIEWWMAHAVHNSFER